MNVEIDRIYNQDCMEQLKSLESRSMDLVILDPNYQDWERLVAEGLLRECVRVLKTTGNIICFTKQPFDFGLRKAVDYMFRREITWTFRNGGAWVSKRMPLVSFQKIYWCTPHKEFFFNPRTGLAYDDSTRDFKRTTKVFGGYQEEGRQFKKSDEGTWMRDHFHYNKPYMGAIPAKPLELLEVFVRCMCPEGGVVLDPFMGSGQTALACMRNGRHFLGYEIDKDVHDLANRRINEERTELTLFPDE